MAVLTRTGLCVLALVLTAACRTGPEQWGPFRGRVVDAETGMAIAGAHVMVLWERDIPSPAHWTQTFYDAQEGMTDTDGYFEIPRETRFFTALVSRPRFAVFAPGYLPQAEEVTPPDGRLYVDPTVLTMRPLKTREDRCRHRPGAPGVPPNELTNFVEAVQRYTTELKCWELREAQP
ncbi:MAG: hypothetical protein HYY76_01695 [Acidobacteria bacterium]|nr:hypothetical protein [Acidobacteriota bacterium]